MHIYTDQLNRKVNLKSAPRRIISLVPSQTELLFDLGLDEEVIGITKFCVHPDRWFRQKTRIGGTKTINIPLVASLQPDLIIANKEENIKEQIEMLENIAPVWISDINNMNDALNMIILMGDVTGKTEKANFIAHQVATKLDNLQAYLKTNPSPSYKTAYLIWKDPYMAAGAGTFINDMLLICGWQNALQHRNRYPEVGIDELRELGTELLLLSSEPYPFQQKHIDMLQEQLPGVKLVLTDGEMFSWYGSRLVQSVTYFKKLILELG